MLSVADLDAVRDSLQPAFAAAHGGSVSAALDRFGWSELLAADPGPAVATVFELLGVTGATCAALGDAMELGLAGVGWPTADVLAGPPGRRHLLPGRLAGGTVTVDGVCIEPDGERPVVVAAETAGGDVRLALVPVAGLKLTPLGGLDPWLGLVSLRGEAPASAVLEGPESEARWPATLAWGRLALAAQLTGLVQASLDLATDHARDRSQFGRPVGTFQAVQHRLADLSVSLEGARGTLSAAVEAQAAGPSPAAGPNDLAAMVAKYTAGRAAVVAAANALQVLAGIGFTWEHPLHRYQKRGLVLDRLLGGSRDLAEEIGAHVARREEIPALVEL